MRSFDYIIDVTELDFDQQVLVFSHQTPVVVDFWAEWCAPCRVLGPILEKLVNEAAGGFRLAKLNVDQNPKLALRYAVQSIPAIKTFREGIVASEFVGVKPEPQIREYLKEVIPSQSDLLLEKAISLLAMEQFEESEVTFRQVMDDSPHHPAALLGLSKCLLYQDKISEVQTILRDFPPSREQTAASFLSNLAQVLSIINTSTELYPEDLQEAAYINSLRLVKMGNIDAALDGLLDILKQDKHHQSGKTKELILGLLELMGDHKPQTREYRRELASILF